VDERQRAKLTRIGGEDIRFDCPMNQYTTFRIGGKVHALYFAGELTDLQKMVAHLSKENIDYLVIGKGSNLLVRDKGYEGVIIILRGKLAMVERYGKDDRLILAGGGLAIGELLEYCKLKELGGLEFLAGIPGTVGGAVAMNAGAFGKETGGMVRAVHMTNRHGELVTRDRSQLSFAYRRLSLSQGSVIVKASFELRHERTEAISERIGFYLKKRKATQPLEYPSGGSVFKNPPNDYAGRLIEKSGLKGKRIGGAMISPKHGNFIVNTGGAKAEDILALMDLVRKEVQEKAGVELEPEIRVVGN